jgi:hypothetical protein
VITQLIALRVSSVSLPATTAGSGKEPKGSVQKYLTPVSQEVQTHVAAMVKPTATAVKPRPLVADSTHTVAAP